MRLRPHRRSLVVWSSSVGPDDEYGAQRFALPARSRRRFRRWVRHTALLAVIGVIRLAATPWARWLLAGGALTTIGILFRNGPGGVVLLPGLTFLVIALFAPSSPKARTELERELASYSTPAQRHDLEAILDRYPDGTTHELRDILAGLTASSPDRQWRC
jgi:hypothetical protein